MEVQVIKYLLVYRTTAKYMIIVLLNWKWAKSANVTLTYVSIKLTSISTP